MVVELLLSHQFSFGINGGVEHAIMACHIALEINPTWMMSDLNSKNAHTFCSRDRLEEELELNVAYHYMVESFKALYGKTVTVQEHFSNGPDMPAITFHLLKAPCMGMRRPQYTLTCSL
jgi:hypothetical protein